VPDHRKNMRLPVIRMRFFFHDFSNFFQIHGGSERITSVALKKPHNVL
jgi:hypothetical protein